MTVRINKTISVLKLGPLGQPTGLPKNCALFSSGSFYFKSKFPSVWPNTKKLAKKTKQIILTFSSETLGSDAEKKRCLKNSVSISGDFSPNPRFLVLGWLLIFCKNRQRNLILKNRQRKNG